MNSYQGNKLQRVWQRVPLWKAGVKQVEGFLWIPDSWIKMLSHITSGSVSSKTS